MAKQTIHAYSQNTQNVGYEGVQATEAPHKLRIEHGWRTWTYQKYQIYIILSILVFDATLIICICMSY